MNRRPIFIGGMMRSGTTLMRNMLGQHSTIAWGRDTNWFDWDWPGRLRPDMQQTLASLARYFAINEDDVRVLAQYLGSPEVFLTILMEELAQREGKERWVERATGNVVHMDRIWRAFPEAQIIQVTRDPRDIFASLLEAKKCDSIQAFVDRWAATICVSEDLLTTLKPTPQNYMVVRYENLVGATESTMRRVFDFLGESWEQVTGDTRQSARRPLNARCQATTKLAVQKVPITSERVGIWRRILSDKDVLAMQQAMADRGYGELYQRAVAAG